MTRKGFEFIRSSIAGKRFARGAIFHECRSLNALIDFLRMLATCSSVTVFLGFLIKRVLEKVTVFMRNRVVCPRSELAIGRHLEAVRLFLPLDFRMLGSIGQSLAVEHKNSALIRTTGSSIKT